MAFNKAKALQDAEKLVAQGKISLAIRQYLHILENEPTDLILLNTAGDLYVRDKNLPEAMKHFYRLAETYMREGFTVKAIAIYKKISKLDPSTIEPVLKLAELYTVQGLTREAREQYTQAIAFYRRKKQDDKVLELLRKIVQIDPENPAHRARLAEFCEQAGRKGEAAQAYLDSAHIALRQGEAAGVEVALKKATSLDPSNPQIRLFKARMALATRKPEEVEKIIASDAELNDLPAAREILLESYLVTHQVEKAETLVLGVYRANPADFTPLASFARLCAEKGDLATALKPLEEVADALIEQKSTGPLTDTLRQIWSKDSYHIPTLKLLCRISEQTADELTLPEVLESLGHAYVQSGELDKAEPCFEKLVEREPENENYRGMLKQVLQKQGKEAPPPSAASLSSVEMALEPEAAPEAVEAAPPEESKEAAAVKEALENSDLFTRYGLLDKAVGELEKVLETYPDQADIHGRILEISQRNNPRRGGLAASALARIFSQRGDLERARKYEEMARAQGAPVAPLAATGEQQKTAEFDLRAANPAQEPAVETGPAPAPEFAFPDESPASAPVSSEEAAGVDLSDDFAAFSAPQPGAPVEEKALSFNAEEARVEVDFYLEQGFAEEAMKAIELYEKTFPGNAQVAELRRRLEQQPAAKVAPKAPEAQPEKPGTPPAAEPVSAGAASAAAEPPATGADMLGRLASDLASSLEGVAPGEPAAPSAAASLSGLLEELGEPAEARSAQDDAETHYSLGVAFREMGLLDEAIGEFQKVVKNTQKGSFPPHFLQACTLLASSFMDKRMPAIATKWYLRALEMPDLDDEATLALLYDLGVAYESSGETRTALEKFTEVYTQNIDYRDVAEKIRLLQLKVS